MDKITRHEVDDLSAKIIVNFGIINTAAIGAVLAADTGITATPFAVGLISAVIAQIVWYIDTAVEYACEGEPIFDNKILDIISGLTVFFLVIGGGCLSGASIIYGCLVFLGVSNAIWWTSIGCGTLFLILFSLLIKIGTIKKAA